MVAKFTHSIEKCLEHDGTPTQKERNSNHNLFKQTHYCNSQAKNKVEELTFEDPQLCICGQEEHLSLPHS